MGKFQRRIGTEKSLRTESSIPSHVVDAKRPHPSSIQLFQGEIFGGRPGTHQEDGTSREHVSECIRSDSGSVYDFERIFPLVQKACIFQFEAIPASRTSWNRSASLSLHHVACILAAMMGGLSEFLLSDRFSEIYAAHFFIPLGSGSPLLFGTFEDSSASLQRNVATAFGAAILPSVVATVANFQTTFVFFLVDRVATVGHEVDQRSSQVPRLLFQTWMFLFGCFVAIPSRQIVQIFGSRFVLTKFASIQIPFLKITSNIENNEMTNVHFKEQTPAMQTPDSAMLRCMYSKHRLRRKQPSYDPQQIWA